MINIPRDIYPIIASDTTTSINGIWARDTDWYEVSMGVNNIAVFYHIVDGKIINTIID